MALSTGWTTSGSNITYESQNTPSANLGDVRTKVINLIDSMRQRYSDLVNSNRMEEAVALKDASERLSRSAMQTGMSTAQRIEALSDIQNKLRVSGMNAESQADIARIGSELNALELLKNVDESTFNQSFKLAMNQEATRSPLVTTKKSIVSSAPSVSKGLSQIDMLRAQQQDQVNEILARQRANMAAAEARARSYVSPFANKANTYSGEITPSLSLKPTQTYVDPMSKPSYGYTSGTPSMPDKYFGASGQVQTGTGTGSISFVNPQTGRTETITSGSNIQPSIQSPLVSTQEMGKSASEILAPSIGQTSSTPNKVVNNKFDLPTSAATFALQDLGSRAGNVLGRYYTGFTAPSRAVKSAGESLSKFFYGL